MDNPYTMAEVQPHFLDCAVARSMCFDALNIVFASSVLAEQCGMAELDENVELSSNFKLHHKLAESRLSELLLGLAVFVRTFDDVMITHAAATYEEHATVTSGENYVGVSDVQEKFCLRDACNKIIHAASFKPNYESVVHKTDDGKSMRIWFLSGEIELAGSVGKKHWNVNLYVEPFLEILLDRISFELPDKNSG